MKNTRNLTTLAKVHDRVDALSQYCFDQLIEVSDISFESMDTMKIGNVKTPLNRIGTVEDIVNVALFLASPASNFITGHNFVVDGGIADVGVPANYLKTDI